MDRLMLQLARPRTHIVSFLKTEEWSEPQMLEPSRREERTTPGVICKPPWGSSPWFGILPVPPALSMLLHRTTGIHRARPERMIAFRPFPGSTWSLPRHSSQIYEGAVSSDESFEHNVPDDDGDCDAAPDDDWEGWETPFSADVSCVSLCGEIVDALGRAQKSRPTDFGIRLDAAPVDEPTSPAPEILTPLTLLSFNSLMSGTRSAG